MAIVMGLDQQRVQITAEWIDTDTGEIGRARVSPAHRGDVRKFFERFAGQRLEVALEATTGWRFVVEELHAIGAVAHLAEPAETAARRGNKKRAKTDRADARHLRELLMIGRVPESWIPPGHLLDIAPWTLADASCDFAGSLRSHAGSRHDAPIRMLRPTTASLLAQTSTRERGRLDAPFSSRAGVSSGR